MAKAKAKTKVDFKEGTSEWKAAELQGRGIGRPPKYKTAEELWEVILGYFEWAEAHPIKVNEVKSFKDDSWDHPKPVARPLTIGSMCIFIGIDESTWRGWRDPDGSGYRADFSTIIHRAEWIIRENKLQGALAGLYNPTITTRVLGLSENVQHSGSVVVKMDSDDSGL